VRLATAAEVRALDAAAIAAGASGGALMARAGAAVARAARALLAPGGRVVVLCGAGNNGGDGWVALRLLHQGGVAARAVTLADPAALHGDARAAFEAAAAAGARWEGAAALPRVELGPGDLAVDALLGTGLARAPEGAYAAAIAQLAEVRGRGAQVLAVDVPSGLSANTGRALGACVTADRTVTFACLKRGLVLHPGPAHAGAVEVVDIGIPAAAEAQVPVGAELLVEAEARALVPPRPPGAHKGDAGRVLVVAGSAGKSGAAHLALTGALRGGAGLVTLAARPEVLPLALAGRPEAMSLALPGSGPLGLDDVAALTAAAEGVDAVVVGPGIPRGAETGAALRGWLERAGKPCVIDADALNALGGSGVAGLAVPAVVTPHPGEMSRLTGRSIGEIQADRLGAAAEHARAWGCVVVLKGAGTVVAAPDAPPAVVAAGNPGMATGGTGDVLAGLVGALLAGGLAPFDAARAAAFAHALAGDLAAARLGHRGLLAGDLALALGEVWARWGR